MQYVTKVIGFAVFLPHGKRSESNIAPTLNHIHLSEIRRITSVQFYICNHVKSQLVILSIHRPMYPGMFIAAGVAVGVESPCGKIQNFSRMAKLDCGLGQMDGLEVAKRDL